MRDVGEGEMTSLDAVVVGSGPNGLAAAVTLARAGLRVQVLEAEQSFGGGSRTLPFGEAGFVRDICSAVHPMALASPFFREFELARRVDFVVPEISFAHGLSPTSAALAYRDLARTAEGLGRDGTAWTRLFSPLVDNIDQVVDLGLNQLLRIPRHPVVAARFGLRVAEQGSPLWNVRFRTAEANALLTGVNAHTLGPMPSLPTAGAGLLLAALGHTVGWPIPRGGSQSIADALADDLRRHGGEILTGVRVRSAGDLPPARATLFDTSARSMAAVLGDRLPAGYRRALARFRYGDGAAKVDFALSGPVPWRNPELRRSPTIHLGGDRSALARSEREVSRGRVPSSPYLLVSQPSLVDDSRAPHGAHSLWTYTHVPRGCEQDMGQVVEDLLESYAPGFKELVVARDSIPASRLSDHDANYIGGDFGAGAVTLTQLVKRPVVSPRPWRTPAEGIYLCSSSSVPGPGVHGMSGWHAARLALTERFGLGPPSLALDAVATTTHRSTVDDTRDRDAREKQ